MNESQELHLDHTFKIILIGDTGTGKSSFIQSYVFDKFVPSYKPTVSS